ncbi:SBBP repeat-containing protein [Streptomyces griseofuscus]|uniref:NHL domain-containing protein n=1 Tax=Streptomyces griseofuscus TaxID=146922 RepID=UPI00342C83B6
MSTAPTEEAAGEDPPALRISTVAGTGAAGFAGDGGPAFSAQLNHPNGIAVDSAGNVYVADYDNHRVRKITADGRIGTVAGTGVGQYRGECAPAAASPLRGPRGLAMDSEDTLFIADDSNHLLRKVPAVGTEAGRLRRVAGLGNVVRALGASAVMAVRRSRPS